MSTEPSLGPLPGPLTTIERVKASFAQNPMAWGFGLALIGAVCFSAKAIVVKLAYAYSVDATTLLAMRMILSAPLFLAALIYTEYKSQDVPRLSMKDLGLIVLAGLLGYYLASLFDFMGLQYITAGLERLILFTYPSIVLLLTSLIHKRRPQAWQLGSMAVTYVGLAVVYGHETALVSENTTLGAMLVFMSAVCYASYMVVGERLLKRLGTTRVTSLATLVSATAILIQVSIQQPLTVILNQPSGVWLLSLINAAFCTFVPVFAVMTAIQLMGASRVSQIGMVGPIATIALGTWILDEPFTLWHAAGTLLVMVGVAMLGMKKRTEVIS